jgi:hypothetical protein
MPGKKFFFLKIPMQQPDLSGHVIKKGNTLFWRYSRGQRPSWPMHGLRDKTCLLCRHATNLHHSPPQRAMMEQHKERSFTRCENSINGLASRVNEYFKYMAISQIKKVASLMPLRQEYVLQAFDKKVAKMRTGQHLRQGGKGHEISQIPSPCFKTKKLSLPMPKWRRWR